MKIDFNLQKRNKLQKNESIGVKFISKNPCSTFPTKCPVCEVKFETASDIFAHLGPNGPHSSAEKERNRSIVDRLDQWLKNYGDLDYSDDSPASLIKQFLMSLPTSEEMHERMNEKLQEIDPEAEITCNLCWTAMDAASYNEHDCAISYTRRWLLNGQQIRCPCVQIYPLKVGMKDVAIPSEMLMKCWKTVQIPCPNDEALFDRGFQKGLCGCISNYNCTLCATEFDNIEDFCVHLLSCIQLNGYKLNEYSVKDLEVMLPLDELDESVRNQLMKGCKPPEKEKIQELRLEKPKVPEVRVESVTSLAGQRGHMKFKQQAVAPPEPARLSTLQVTDSKKSNVTVPERPPFINQQLFTESPLPAIPNGTYLCQQFPPACIPSCVPSSFACVFSPITSPGPVYFVYGEAASHVMNKGTKVATITLNQSSAATNVTTPTNSVDVPRMSTTAISSMVRL